MESDLSSVASTSRSPDAVPEIVKQIEWEDYDQEVSRLWSLTSALKAAKDRKFNLETTLSTSIEAKTESIVRRYEVEEMRERVKSKEAAMKAIQFKLEEAMRESAKEEENLNSQVILLLVACSRLSVASKSLQESNKLLEGEKGHLRLKRIQQLLRMRQQYMISQISLIYPVKMVADHSEELELESFPSSSRSGYYLGSRTVNQESLAILGLHLSLLPFTKTSFFPDKKEAQDSSAALGYVSHMVTLLGSYLKLPLRYPIRLGGSRSYVIDHSPSISASPEASSVSSSIKVVEVPLFLEGRDTTRAAYAVFLLNKDLEQLLNFIGVKSLGPRNVLENLKELIRSIQSVEFLDS